GRIPFISNGSYIGLAAPAKLTTASTFKGGRIVEEGNTIVGVYCRSVKNFSRILEKLKPFRRGFPAAEKKGCNARHNSAQYDHSFPYKPCGKYQMGSCTKRRQQSHQRRFSHSNPTLGQRQKRRKLCQRPRKKPIPQRKKQPAGDGQQRCQCEKRGLYRCPQNPSEKQNMGAPRDASKRKTQSREPSPKLH